MKSLDKDYLIDQSIEGSGVKVWTMWRVALGTWGYVVHAHEIGQETFPWPNSTHFPRVQPFGA